jgi:polysaccharide deacetylase family protein (PEP-CTERM system associated)
MMAVETAGYSTNGYVATLGIDVEDWYHAENVQPACPRSMWHRCESRVEASVGRLLDILEEAGTKATFFVLGCLAERYPQTLIERIAGAGHELASHGYNHHLLSSLSDAEFREDAYRSKALLEDIAGRAVWGYRAPSFSIHLRALDILSELGYVYDSSLNPVWASSRYGKVCDSRLEKSGALYRVGDLYEVPMSRFELLGVVPVPFSGGGYFRLFPWPLWKMGVRRILREHGFYNFYLHPWEIDPGFPKVREIGFLSRFRHHVNLEKTEGRFRSLLREVRFRPVSEALPEEVLATPRRGKSENLESVACPVG